MRQEQKFPHHEHQSDRKYQCHGIPPLAIILRVSCCPDIQSYSLSYSEELSSPSDGIVEGGDVDVCLMFLNDEKM